MLASFDVARIDRPLPLDTHLDGLATLISSERAEATAARVIWPSNAGAFPSDAVTLMEASGAAACTVRSTALDTLPAEATTSKSPEPALTAAMRPLATSAPAAPSGVGSV